MPSILLVDDDESVLQNMERLFRVWGRGKFSVKCCPNVGMAISLLRAERFDVAVTDLCMPVVSGVEFLKILARFHPSTTRVMMTGFPDELDRIGPLKDDSATVFISKPCTSEELQNFYQTIEGLAQQPGCPGFCGTVREVSLGEIIQMYCLSRLSIELVVSGEIGGRIHVYDGELIHAEAGADQGFAALVRLMGAHSGSFQTNPLNAIFIRTLEEGWEKLLLKCAHNVDEELETPYQYPGPAQDLEHLEFSADDNGDLVVAHSAESGIFAVEPFESVVKREEEE